MRRDAYRVADATQIIDTPLRGRMRVVVGEAHPAANVVPGLDLFRPLRADEEILRARSGFQGFMGGRLVTIAEGTLVTRAHPAALRATAFEVLS